MSKKIVCKMCESTQSSMRKCHIQKNSMIRFPLPFLASKYPFYPLVLVV